MVVLTLEEAKTIFEVQKNAVEFERKELHKLREEFISHFTLLYISTMKIKDYAIGWGRENNRNFCYRLERELDGLGRSTGANSKKFGVYYKKVNEEYIYTKRFGSGDEGFKTIRKCLIDLLNYGKKGDLAAIGDNMLSTMFKGKILSTYYPDKYLNVFSIAHLDYFLRQLNLDIKQPTLASKNEYFKKAALVDFKNQDSVMKTWSIDLFSHFLYHFFPGRPPKDIKIYTEGDDGTMPNFPTNPKPSIITLDIIPLKKPALTDKIHRTLKVNPDYEKQAKKIKLIGDRGEEIILEMEKAWLRRIGEDVLASEVRPAKRDSDGYDILSFDEDGRERYIEVKTTTFKPGHFNFFLTANELKKAHTLRNYNIYIVFDILNPNPKVWIAGNLFKPENPNMGKEPILYRIGINTALK